MSTSSEEEEMADGTKPSTPTPTPDTCNPDAFMTPTDLLKESNRLLSFAPYSNLKGFPPAANLAKDGFSYICRQTIPMITCIFCFIEVFSNQRKNKEKIQYKQF
jgi:hypothetical protein